MKDAVRPTQRCLHDLGEDLPDLGVRLSDLDHPLIVKTQALPAQVVAGGAERIKALTDRVWFKVKSSVWRGAAANLEDMTDETLVACGAWWWLGAAGQRQDDSAQHDFYQQLSNECHRAGRNTCSTDSLLPSKWDVNRLLAEAAVNATQVLEILVRKAAAQSLLNSDIRGFVVGDRDVRVRIKVQNDGQAYIVIGATGSLDASFFMALVSAIPGVPTDDWMPEPGGHVGFDLTPGEVVWSAMVSAEAQTEILKYDQAVTW